MRVYLPATVSTLAAALAEDPVQQFSPGVGYAVTPGLREWYASGDTEELEYAALSLAAEASIALIAADPAAPRRRVVVAAEIADPAVVAASTDADRSARGQVSVGCPVPLSWVAAVHVDDQSAEDAVAAAAATRMTISSPVKRPITSCSGTRPRSWTSWWRSYFLGGEPRPGSTVTSSIAPKKAASM